MAVTFSTTLLRQSSTFKDKEDIKMQTEDEICSACLNGKSISGEYCIDCNDNGKANMMRTILDYLRIRSCMMMKN